MLKPLSFFLFVLEKLRRNGSCGGWVCGRGGNVEGERRERWVWRLSLFLSVCFVFFLFSFFVGWWNEWVAMRFGKSKRSRGKMIGRVPREGSDIVKKRWKEDMIFVRLVWEYFQSTLRRSKEWVIFRVAWDRIGWSREGEREKRLFTDHLELLISNVKAWWGWLVRTTKDINSTWTFKRIAFLNAQTVNFNFDK